ncbi:MAG: urease accessory protein UreF [Alistipes sp.]|nr:urease accessory protein UreF [Alistipes sp.]
MNDNATTVMRLLAFTDSAFPVGTFAFSGGLETAADMGAVHDEATLEEYVRDMAHQAAFTDGIAALQAYRAYLQGDYDTMLQADRYVILCKMNAEARLMTRRMGRKMVELSQKIFSDDTVARLSDDIRDDATPGTYPVAQAAVFAACGISERNLFCSHQYGVTNMILGAALRSLRVSHYQTQRIMFDAADEIDSLYDEVRELDLDDMCAFSPHADIIASLHEKGTKRMFMN